MQQHTFGNTSEMVSHAGYDRDKHVLYLTYHSGPTTIAYRNVTPSLWEELLKSAYPDVCIRFKIQAHHPFRRVEPAFRPLHYSFVK
ncbi:hypothetical protein GGR26_001069 [Lewinella marina]|nr:KTSC domain-containing protein [Neolewinella marina]NJB85324.1 hypothetical protein [Neolewinella marina]